MNTNVKDLAAGAAFIAVGVLYGWLAWSSLPIGEALNMGPGYFPLVLSGSLVMLGAAIAARARVTVQVTPFGVVPWRGIVMLSLATLVFAAFVEELGLLAGIFLTGFVAALADREVKIVNALAVSLGIALFCTAVFAYGVHLPIPVMGRWPDW